MSCRLTYYPLLTDIFKFDSDYFENEEKYKAIKVEILGEDSEEGSESEDESEDSEDEGMWVWIVQAPTVFKNFQLRKRRKA